MIPIFTDPNRRQLVQYENNEPEPLFYIQKKNISKTTRAKSAYPRAEFHPN
jgi:hypothetical protein